LAPTTPAGWALVTCLAVFGVVCVATLRSDYLQDTWLALVSGREIVTHGLPHHDSLTVFAHGRRWVDQQWLAQLAMYGIDRLLGLPGLGLAQVVLTVTAIGGATVAGHRAGASPETLLLLFPWCAFLLLEAGFEVRTQAYAYPLFLAVLLLLASDARRPGRRVLWVLPALALWANVHGSVLLGVVLVEVRALSLARAARRGRAPGALARAVLLASAAPACLLLTPYGLQSASYYRATLFSPAIHRYVTEWQPVTSTARIAIPFAALCAVLAWAMRRRHGLASWDQFALAVLAVNAALALRGVVWFAVAALAIGSPWVEAEVRARRAVSADPRLRLHRALALTSVVALAGAALFSFSHRGGWFVRRYPAALATATAAASRSPDVRVYADDRYADWLLWRIPALAGRIAFDARFELLSSARIAAISRFASASGPHWQRAARGFSVLVLPDDANAARALRARALVHAGGGLVLLSG
jgi:hypothetical protein